MKNLIFIPLFIYTLFSCSKDDETVFPEYPQKWKLVKMAGQIPNSVTTGSDMTWQEFYLLKEDGSFIKSRTQDGVTINEPGTFTFEDSDTRYLVLTYETDNSIIGNCSPEWKELLTLESNKLFSTWSACDGPGLEYQRAE